MVSEDLISLDLKRSQVVVLTLTSGKTKTFIFYSTFNDGITGYGMYEVGVDLQFIPLIDIEKIIRK